MLKCWGARIEEGNQGGKLRVPEIVVGMVRLWIYFDYESKV